MRTTASLRMQPGTTPPEYMMWSAIRCLSSSGQPRGPALQRQVPCTDCCVKHTVWARSAEASKVALSLPYTPVWSLQAEHR